MKLLFLSSLLAALWIAMGAAWLFPWGYLDHSANLCGLAGMLATMGLYWLHFVTASQVEAVRPSSLRGTERLSQATMFFTCTAAWFFSVAWWSIDNPTWLSLLGVLPALALVIHWGNRLYGGYLECEQGRCP